GVGAEAVAMLIERRHRQRRTELHGAAVWCKRAGQHPDQRGLAAAVRTYDADAVAAQHAGREILDDGTALVALADALRLDHLRAGGRGLARRDRGAARRPAMRAPGFAQRLQG